MLLEIVSSQGVLFSCFETPNTDVDKKDDAHDLAKLTIGSYDGTLRKYKISSIESAIDMRKRRMEEGWTKDISFQIQSVGIDKMLDDLVWCGVVWCGVVWCGVVWCGVV